MDIYPICVPTVSHKAKIIIFEQNHLIGMREVHACGVGRRCFLAEVGYGRTINDLRRGVGGGGSDATMQRKKNGRTPVSPTPLLRSEFFSLHVRRGPDHGTVDVVGIGVVLTTFPFEFLSR